MSNSRPLKSEQRASKRKARKETRRCLFIRESETRVWVPPPESVAGGWARHLWLAEFFGAGRSHIASEARWTELQQRFAVEELIERDGHFSVRPAQR